MTEVSVVLPTFNESGTVCATISHLQAALETPEIIVVDDDSPDETAEQVHQEYGSDPSVRVIVRTEESGLGSAVLRGFDAASGDVLGCMDADLQHPPATMAQLVNGVRDGADIAVGSRRLDSGGVASEWSTRRRVISYGADTLARLAVPHCRRLSDPMSGLFAIDTRAVAPVRNTLQPEGYKILLELVTKCPISRVDEVPFVFGERQAGDSNLGPAEYVRYLRHLAKLTIPARRPSVQWEDRSVPPESPPTGEVTD